ncbi:hypothetical protein A2434_00850 [Candidatus Woesebacteria bacterium RIFOXYC1_FULL_41_14]|uniref:Uncharacterized protein n=2 Tax=Candidatus Woeseibacteriota TaxID=1752722 RepID=A0A1F8DEQ5_9BACT|nr:MAG: hypothetical protein A2393_02970 [Candidatus Woesebacteria bacterium RIFOXYB1_FULL_41_13]OGM83897.1 MAG: hypothetical protein A2434_00850 [Candidatus Woesebacteria bacterium RIFOXYC1_FULL_41_14]OGM87083.1 MAG: hypothetical protein A2594_00325 [Candidatus Woesebacteria bacterium RIFOXYD1_FULL_41_28]
MRKNKRKEQVLKRKNFLPTLLLTVLFWVLLGLLVYFVDPKTFAATPLFFVILFVTFLFTFSLLFANSRRGLISSISLTLFSILLFLGVGNLLNLALILAIGTCTEIYFSLR